MLRIWDCVGCELSFEPEELTINRDEIGLCHSCLALLKPPVETTRNCPDDGTAMVKKSAYELLLIDRCLTCEGVWLDSHELKVISKINKAMKDKSVAWAYLLGWPM